MEEEHQQLNAMAIRSAVEWKDNSDATTSQKRKFYFGTADRLIFAIIGEELGFVGCCVVIILLLLIVIECIVIGLGAKDI